MGKQIPEPRLVRIPGRRKWYVRWTERGRSVVRSTGAEDRGAAERFKDRFVAALEAGDRPTISERLDRYIAARTHLASHHTLKYFTVRPKAEWGNLYPEDLSDERVGRYIEKHGQRTMTRRELELVAAAIGRKLPLPARRPPRQRFLTRTEAQRLHDAAQSLHMRLFVQLAMTTGRRAGAILDLTWDRVDLERGIIDFRNPDRGETKKRRGVCTVPPYVVAALQDARQFARTDYVIEYRGKPVTRIWNGFKKLAERAGVPWAHPHLLKHSLISWLAEEDVSPERIADFTDTDPQTVRRIYRKVNPESLRDVSDVIARMLDHTVKKASDGNGG